MKSNNTCPNCSSAIIENQNYCSSCGQKQVTVRIKLKHLLHDFFAGLFNIDNQFFRTFRNIWIPGRLTQLFFEGKRKRYTHPLRLYLFLSFLLFGLLSYEFNQLFSDGRISEALDTRSKLQVKQDLLELDSLVNALKLGTTNKDYSGGAEALMFLFALDTTLAPVLDTIELDLGYIDLQNKVDSIRWLKNNEEILMTYNRASSKYDSAKLLARSLFDKKIGPDSLHLSLPFLGRGMNNMRFARKDLVELKADELYQKYEIKGFKEKLIVNQVAKVFKDPAKALLYVLSGFSWIALLFIPFMALWMALIYIRKKNYYVEHLIFIVHTTSMLFLYTLLFRLFDILTEWEWINVLFLLFPFYLLFAMKNYYQQSWFKTILKWAVSLNVALLLMHSLGLLSILLRMAIY